MSFVSLLTTLIQKSKGGHALFHLKKKFYLIKFRVFMPLCTPLSSTLLNDGTNWMRDIDDVTDL